MTVKRIISSVFVIGMLLAPLSTYTSYAIEGNDSTDTSSTEITFNKYLSMTDAEVLSNYNINELAECGFGDEAIEDSVKFEKYLNTPPAFYTGNNYCSPDYGAYKKFIKGEAKPYLTFYVNMNTALSEEISPDEFGYPSEWKIEPVNGKWVVEMADGTKIINPIHEYRLYVPVEIISDFETYVRLEASNKHFTDIEQNSNYGIYICEDIVGQFKSYGAGEAVIDGTLAGDANFDGKTTVGDAVAILQYVGNRDKYQLTDQGKLNADVDGVDGITANDALTIQRWDSQGKL